eukprot:TRINITY_DN44126_c0_g1_i12.p1 TRINITY_DN44126_c0_g1~~TRINITY_DN44126_c0_g1_i12.p1  ORF type:complete len:220 (+),score=21.56 TRINITY_DN44126_c0_g1_i12:481-1140(+)
MFLVSMNIFLIICVIAGFCAHVMMCFFQPSYIVFEGTQHGQTAYLLLIIIPGCVEPICNALGTLALSGAIYGSHASEQRQQSRKPTVRLSAAHTELSPTGDSTARSEILWARKVEELSQRGTRLSDLLNFYEGHGKQYMLHYNKDVHTTHDVVRAAIVPLTEASGLSYAAMVSGGPGVVPDRMVTHTWSNLFRDTMAALVADALGRSLRSLSGRLSGSI